MKLKATRKQIRDSHVFVIHIPYCDLQHLLTYSNPIAYNCGVYGWNWDCYSFGANAIVTGYRNTFGYRPNTDLINEYDNKAKEITSNYSLDYDTKSKELNNLIWDFITECKEEYRNEKN